ncbi:hypothetical protein TTHERM_00590500 (macronuclear) [Tetrahymena thermophila SB210]|uniref:GTF3C1 extended winged-helix domain-containing protein n=1 Tax=Tetrahymena thermophila (strain SB210) TaxID=312017 RepID=I7LVU0_TETTS|nr:hypothetical protein TTHERM_00590500 [Tetrahymena thermophila SB210]EAR99713.1 hypothetical protein TTHERM_00590500 [Tetrahymena thermophila SB210]|eukprot:XP_001019958.1 hypothetical protein TTHERM_00590500 [Tetrahymena thermophila SB210]
MELLVKKTIKILSFQEQNSLELTQILPSLQPLINSVNQEKFVQKLKENHNIQVDDSKKDKIFISLNREKAKESNDEKQLSLFFKEDKTNKSLYYLYRLILKAGPGGINYSDLASQFNSKFFKEKTSDSKIAQSNSEKGGEKSNKKNGKKNEKESQQTEEYEKDIKKLDITNVSHYCRKLFTLKFINILPEKVCKKAVATKFQDKCLQIDTKVKRKQTMASQMKTEIDLDEMKKQQFTKLSIVSEPWKYLKEDTFILNELTFNQNILLNFASYEAFLREGLLQTEIASKINKLGERKMLVRSLENIIDDYKVLSTADRQGRTFSLKFHIKSQVMADYIDQLLKENKINLKKELEDMQRQQMVLQPINAQNDGNEEQQQHNNNGNQIQSKLQFSNSGEPKENRFLEIKIEEKQNQNGVNQSNLQSKNQSNTKQVNPAESNNEKMNQNMAQINQRQELFNQNPKLNYTSFEHIYKYFQENEKLVQDLIIAAGDKEFVKKLMKIPPSYNDSDYQKFSELLLKVINETVEFTYVRTKKGQEGGIQNEQLNRQKVSKKQISRNKLNRYIHILNRIEEKKVIKNLNLKKYIIALEKNQGVGEIDKKTLEHILNTFQFINYITVKKIKIDIQTISQNIVRSITIHKDVPEDDPRVIKAEKTISKGLLKKGPKQDESYSSDSDSESDYQSHFNTQNQQSKSSGISKLQVTKNNGQQGKINAGKQSDITNFFIKKQRNLQPNQKIYYYDEDENDQENNSMLQEQVNKLNSNTQIQANPQRKTSLQMQLQEALSKVTKENCEIPAGPEKMKILASLIFQFMEKKLTKNYKDTFDKINEINYSTIYTTLYFQKEQVEFKYPLFQQNLCNNLLQLSQSHKMYPNMMDLELDTLDINSTNLPTVEQLIDEAFTSPQDSAFSSLSESTYDYLIPIKPKEIFLEEAQALLEKNNQNKKEIEKLQISLSALKGKDTKNQKNLIQDALLKFKSYLIRYPCRKLIDTKLRYQMVDYYSFLNQCVQSDSIKFFKLNKENQFYEKIRLSEISLENIDSVYYQITNNYYNHFNLFQQETTQSQ